MRLRSERCSTPMKSATISRAERKAVSPESDGAGHEKFPNAMSSSAGTSSRLAMSDAGCERNTAPTRIISPVEKRHMTTFIPLLR